MFTIYPKKYKKSLKYYYFYGIMNAKAFVILDLKALADTQIRDLLPAYRAIIS